MESYKQWLLKSGSDLKSAKKLAGGDDPLLDTALFHTQQAVEKCLKGFLAYHKQPLKKTHDLELLLDFCLEIDQGFEIRRICGIVDTLCNGIQISRYNFAAGGRGCCNSHSARCFGG